MDDVFKVGFNCIIMGGFGLFSRIGSCWRVFGLLNLAALMCLLQKFYFISMIANALACAKLLSTQAFQLTFIATNVKVFVMFWFVLSY